MSDAVSSPASSSARPPAPAPAPTALHLDGRATVLLVACCALWGLNQVAVKAAMPEVPTLVQLSLRSLLACALLLGWMRVRGIRWRDHRHTLGPGLLSGVIFAVEFGLMFIGLQHTTAARSVVFINTSPFIVAVVLAVLLPAERLRPLQITGLVLAFASIAWAFGEGVDPSGDAAHAHRWQGDALILAAAALWGLTTVIVRLTSLRSAPFELTLAYQLVMAALLSPLGAWWAGHWDGLASPLGWSALAWGSILYQAVIVTFASYLLWFWLLMHYPATRVQAFVFLSPVFGTTFAGLLLGEPVGAGLMMGLAGVALGLTLLNRR